ncbi:hypothetical protein KPL70_007698 [Citrus sinensis]|nr:hypothetical protein KPL70_007698 [Citrus sinensis]
MSSNNKMKWYAAMYDEITSLSKNNTWILVNKPPNKKLIRSKWIFKLKAGASNKESPRQRARLVAKGFTQREGVDFNEVFSPVVKYNSTMLLLALSAYDDLKLEQMDVKTAFLHDSLDEEIFMAQPEGFIERESEDKIPYNSSVVGSIMYVMVCTRPDLAHEVGVINRFMRNQGKGHWSAVQWVLRYLKGTIAAPFVFEKIDGTSPEVAGFVDSDYAADMDIRRSITGFVFTMCGGAISWKSSLQPIIALSMTEAEYIALTEAVKEAIWLRGMNFIKDEISKRVVNVVKVPSEVNSADMLTKPLPSVKFRNLLNLIGSVGL